MLEKLHAEKREELGTTACRRLRKAGQIPAVMYGHGEANVNLTLRANEVEAALRHGSHLIELSGAVNDSALFDVQWDALGTEVLHLDLTRVNAEETVEVELPVELRGEAPGTKEGGVVLHTVHTLTLRCPAGVIPEKLQLTINELHLGESIAASEIELPDKASLVDDPETIIVQCTEPEAEEEVDEEGTGGLEPEVIGRKPDEDEEGED